MGYSITQAKRGRQTIYFLKQHGKTIAKSTNKHSLHRLLAQLMGITL